MKKIIIAVRKDEKLLEEKTVYYEKLKDARKEEGYVAVLHSENVKHPSPETLRHVLAKYNVELSDFYSYCEAVKKELDSENTSEETGNTTNK